MALLDSILAFALTLAALATVVTIFLEIYTRIRGLKAARQVQLFTTFFKEVIQTQLPSPAAGDRSTPQEREWEFVKAVLQNRLSKRKMAASEGGQWFVGWLGGAIYDDVSLEHVLRRLLETNAASSLLTEAESTLKAKLGLIARKYEEYCSALGADFKRNALRRSIWVGILLAFGMNVDGVRLLTGYLQDPELRARVIEKLEIPAEEQESAPPANGVETPATEGGLPAQNADASDPGATVLQNVGDAKAQLALIDELNLPIGTSFFPQCYWFFDAAARSKFTDPLCQRFDGKDSVKDWTKEDRSLAVVWFLKVLLTGILIGLGAPFWYDVAKRLAAVRQAFNGKGSAEEGHRGADAGGNAESRDSLINQIVDEIKDAIAAGVKVTAGGDGKAGGAV